MPDSTAPAASLGGRLYPDPNEAIETGRRQIAALTRRFFAQHKQPTWIKLSASLYPGDKWHLHSSQISGWPSGKLRDPSPKAILVLGHLNLSLFASLRGGLVYEGIGEVPRLPEDMRHLWGHLEPMLLPDGDPIGPLEIYEINTGLRDLGLNVSRTITAEQEDAASAAVGKALRLGLAAKGVDFLSDIVTLRSKCSSMEPLLMGKTVAGPLLLGDLPALAGSIDRTEEDLWLVVADATASLRSAGE
jgi:hypothetical protein